MAQTTTRDRFLGHANLMSSLTLVSRVAGLVRDKAWSYFLGAKWQFAAFWMGFQFPNLSRRIFGEGALTAAFVPIYTEILQKEGQAAASRFASAVVSLLVTLLGVLTLVGECIAIPIALSPAISDHNRVAAGMIAIMLPYCVMICVVAIFGAIATVHEKFAAQALNPIVLNLLTALGAGLSVWVMAPFLGGKDYPLQNRIVWVAISVVAAGMVQVLMMAPTLHACGVRLRWIGRGAALAETGVGALVKTFLPIMLASSAIQINTFMDTQIAWWLSPDGHNGQDFFTLFGHAIHVAMGPGAGAKLSMAQRVYLLPVGIFGVATAAAVFPPMARAAGIGDLVELKRLLVVGLKKTLFISIPSSFGMILIARPLITLVYGGGQTQPDDIERAYWAAIFFCVGIWAFEGQMVILRVYFVLKDTVTPTRVSLAMIGLNFLLNLTLVWFLREGGIALATTTAAIVQGGILLAILRKRLGRLGMRQLAGNVGKSVVATLVMVQAGWLLSLIRFPWETGGAADMREKWLTAGVKLPMLVLACGAVYVAIARFFGMREVEDLPLVGRWLRRR